MAEQTYQDYKLSRLGQAPEVEEAPPASETAAEPAEAADDVETPVATQDSPPVAPSDEAVEDEETDDDGAEPPPSPRRNRRDRDRWKRLTDNLRTKDLENAQLRGRLEALEQYVQRQAAAETPADTAPSGRPNRADFDDDDDFIEAVADWKADEKIQATLVSERQRTEQAQRQQHVAQAQQTYAEREQTTRTRHADYDEVVGGSDVVLSEAATAAILDSEYGPDVVYYLAQHPEAADTLNRQTTAMGLGRALGRLESVVQTPNDTDPPPPPPELPPALPAPIEPLSGSGATPPTRPLDKVSYKDYKAARLKQGRT